MTSGSIATPLLVPLKSILLPHNTVIILFPPRLSTFTSSVIIIYFSFLLHHSQILSNLVLSSLKVPLNVFFFIASFVLKPQWVLAVLRTTSKILSTLYSSPSERWSLRSIFFANHFSLWKLSSKGRLLEPLFSMSLNKDSPCASPLVHPSSPTHTSPFLSFLLQPTPLTGSTNLSTPFCCGASVL